MELLYETLPFIIGVILGFIINRASRNNDQP